MSITNIHDLWLSIRDRDKARLAEMLRAIHDQEDRDREARARYREEDPPCQSYLHAFDDDSGQPTSGPL